MSRNPGRQNDGDSRYGGNGHTNRIDDDAFRGRREGFEQGDQRDGSQGSRYLPESEQRPGMRRDDWERAPRGGEYQGSNFNDTEGYGSGGDERYYQSYENRDSRQSDERGGRGSAYGESRGYGANRDRDQGRDSRGQGGSQNEGRYQGLGGDRSRFASQQGREQGQGYAQDPFGFQSGPNQEANYGRAMGGAQRGSSGRSGWQGDFGSGGASNRDSRFQSQEGFAGKGPRGYQRSDDRIKEEVSEALADHAGIDASDIEVSVEGGMVTLTGGVSDRYAKRIAVEAVEDLRGVKDVHNQLRISSTDSKPSQSGGFGGASQTTGQYGQGSSSRSIKEPEKGTEKDANKERATVSR